MKRKISIILLLTIVISVFTIVLIYLAFSPKDIRLTNLTHTSVTITWNTRLNTRSVMCMKSYTDNIRSLVFLESTSFYEDDKGSKGMAFRNHSITVEDLDPSTDYMFAVGNRFFIYKDSSYFSENFTFTRTNNFKTYETPETVVVPMTIYGSVDIEDKENLPQEALVFVDIEGFPFSTVLNDEARWSFDLSIYRDKNGEIRNLSKELSDIDIFIDGAVYGNSDVLKEKVKLNEYFGSIELNN